MRNAVACAASYSARVRSAPSTSSSRCASSALAPGAAGRPMHEPLVDCPAAERR